jgi:2-oxoglutarate ferredoxin oxidoreductase subunit beta
MRGEKITAIFVNNAIYGMTGGQMAPTTLVGQKASTVPLGRDEDHIGQPIKVSEMIATIPKAVYVERVSSHDVKHIRQAKKAIKKAFQIQMDRKGFSMVEILSTCPTGWGLTPVDATKWLEENMIPYYPLGCYKSEEEVK